MARAATKKDALASTCSVVLARVLDVEAQAFQHPEGEIQPEDHDATREDPDEPLEDDEGDQRDLGERAQRKNAQQKGGE
jgi:hypothetical protein